MRRLVWASLLALCCLLGPLPVLASYVVPPTCQVADLDSCGGQQNSAVAVVIDGANAWDCTAGSGTDEHLCFRSVGGTWQVVGQGTAITGTTGVTFTLNQDLTGVGAGQLDVGGPSSMLYGSADVQSHAFITDGAGDGEISLPNLAIGSNEWSGQAHFGHFCGNGPNGATPNYMAPTTRDGSDHRFGEAGCDAQDNADPAVASTEIQPWGIKAYQMRCFMGPAGTDDTVTFTLLSDEVAVSNFSCSVAVNGTDWRTCTAPTSPTSTTILAADTEQCIRIVGVDDDMTTADAECYLYFVPQ